MADAQQHIDFVEVKSKDIITDRQTGWTTFTRAGTWVIAGVVVLLIALKMVFG